MATPIKFGTDGWRGVIADDYTFENLRRCAQGMARYLIDGNHSSRGLVIGYGLHGYAIEPDTHFLHDPICPYADAWNEQHLYRYHRFRHYCGCGC